MLEAHTKVLLSNVRTGRTPHAGLLLNVAFTPLNPMGGSFTHAPPPTLYCLPPPHILHTAEWVLVQAVAVSVPFIHTGQATQLYTSD